MQSHFPKCNVSTVKVEGARDILFSISMSLSSMHILIHLISRTDINHTAIGLVLQSHISKCKDKSESGW